MRTAEKSLRVKKNFSAYFGICRKGDVLFMSRSIHIQFIAPALLAMYANALRKYFFYSLFSNPLTKMNQITWVTQLLPLKMCLSTKVLLTVVEINSFVPVPVIYLSFFCNLFCQISLFFADFFTLFIKSS